jgi:hypothetical protein
MHFVQAYLHHNGRDQWRHRELDEWLWLTNKPMDEPVQGGNE